MIDNPSAVVTELYREVVALSRMRGEGKSWYALGRDGVEVKDAVLAHLRLTAEAQVDASKQLPELPEGQAKGEAPANRLDKKVAKLERAHQANQTPQAKRKQTRIQFIRARVAKKTWQEIADDWRAKPPHAWNAENLADAMRLFWSRQEDEPTKPTKPLILSVLSVGLPGT